MCQEKKKNKIESGWEIISDEYSNIFYIFPYCMYSVKFHSFKLSTNAYKSAIQR